MKHSVYFANINGPTTPRIIPLAWGLLRAYAETNRIIKHAYDWPEPLILYEEAEGFLDGMSSPGVVAASCYFWNLAESMDVLRRAKDRHPQLVTIAGGPSIPDVPGDFFENYPFVDVLVHGEGETPFRQLLIENLKDKPALQRIKGISFRENGKTLSTGPQVSELTKHISDVDFPSPYLLGYFDEIIERWKRKPLQAAPVSALVETNRGCPYRCTFCAWGAAALNKLKIYESSRILEEFSYLSNKGVPVVIFCDANFGILERDVSFAHKLADLRKSVKYPRRVSFCNKKMQNQQTVEIVTTLHGAGLIETANLSLQSMNPDVIEAIRRPNMKLEKQLEVKRAYHSRGVPVYVEFILGLPKETRQTFMDGLCEALERGFDEVRIYFASLLENTELATQKDTYGLVTGFRAYDTPVSSGADESTSDYEHGLTLGEYVFGTNTMSTEDWCDCATFGWLFIRAMHVRGYTRLIARYFVENEIVDYRGFYGFLWDHHSGNTDTLVATLMRRLTRAFGELARNERIPVRQIIQNMPDMVEDIKDLLPDDHEPGKAHWEPDEWAWIVINRSLDRFYDELLPTLTELAGGSAGSGSAVSDRARIEDLIRFQKSLILTRQYDPSRGKRETFQYDWKRYFFGDGELQATDITVEFTDQAMGPKGDIPIIPEQRALFAYATLGPLFYDGPTGYGLHNPSEMRSVVRI